MEDWKVKTSVLWLFIAVIMVANTLLYFLVPGVIDEIRAGRIVGLEAGQELVLMMAVMYFWAPLVMAVSSLVLKHDANRWANVALGSFYAVFILFELTMNVTDVAYPYVILMDASAVVASMLIVWYALRLKQVYEVSNTSKA